MATPTEHPVHRSDFESYFEEVLRESVTALAAAMGAARRAAPESTLVAESGATESAGVVGFTGTDLCGMISVSVRGGGPYHLTSAHEDWVGEMANQIAGRVKIKLCRRGVSYTITPPMTLRGHVLTVNTRGTSIHFEFDYEGAIWSLHALIEAQGSIDLDEPDDQQHYPAEGDLLLF